MSPRTVQILHFNDVYHVDDFEGRSDRALRMRLAMEPYLQLDKPPLVTFGGDLLAPSLMSSATKGKHMVETLELLGVHVATLGNHDLDFGANVARSLMTQPTLFDFEGPPREARCQWVQSNMNGLDGEPLAGAQRWLLRDWQGVCVGILAVSEDWLSDAGLSPQSSDPDKHATWLDEVESARAWAASLREAGAELVLCLCHDTLRRTEQLAESVPEVDFFLGGHEHIYVENPRFVIAGYDFEDFCLLTFQVPEPGSSNRPDPPLMQRVAVAAAVPSAAELQRMPLSSDAARLRQLVSRYEQEVRASIARPLTRKLAGGEEVVCSLAAELDTRKFLLRTQEMPAGNLFADAVFESLKHHGAECAILISGQISVGPGRAPAGPLTMGHVVQWFPWEGGTCIVEVPGAVLLEALEHGAHLFPYRYGMFPQVSALSFSLTVDAEAPDGGPGAPGRRISDVQVAGQPLNATRRYKVATGDYLASGGDGFAMLAAYPKVVSPESAPLLHAAVADHLRSLGPVIQPPALEGRIRNLRTFRMHVPDAELGATSMDPANEEETIVRCSCTP